MEEPSVILLLIGITDVISSWTVFSCMLTERTRFSATQKLPVLISTKSSLNNCYDKELDYAFSMDDPMGACPACPILT